MVEPVLRAGAIVKQLHGAFCRGVDRGGLLQLAAEKIRAAGPPYTSVYLYMVNGGDDALELGAFDGRETQHTSIPVGRGLCGKAVSERRDLNVADVAATPEYLACSRETRSELIILIRRHDEILGQIDIDSDMPDGFSDAEQAAVKEVADALATLL